jgi:hypothetical protein
VQPGQSNERPTYTEHVWRIADFESGRIIASVIARSSGSTVIIMEDKDSTSKPIQQFDTTNSLQLDEQAKGLRRGKVSKTQLQTFTKKFNVWVVMMKIERREFPTMVPRSVLSMSSVYILRQMAVASLYGSIRPRKSAKCLS